MNVQDTESDVGFDGTWVPIFQRQRELMDKYHHIEAVNGLMQTGRVPVDIDCRFGQARLKDFAWRVTEELAESWEAVANNEQLHAQEECADALHFMVELCHLSNVGPYGVIPMHDAFGLPSAAPFLTVYNLGLAMNCLKNKPWKQTHVPTDRQKYETLVVEAFKCLCQYAKMLELTPETLHDMYFRKSNVNKFRVESNY